MHVEIHAAPLCRVCVVVCNPSARLMLEEILICLANSVRRFSCGHRQICSSVDLHPRCSLEVRAVALEWMPRIPSSHHRRRHSMIGEGRLSCSSEAMGEAPCLVALDVCACGAVRSLRIVDQCRSLYHRPVLP
jgi:hypothetical protein